MTATESPARVLPRRGIATVADIRARVSVDPLTGCWHWLGAKSAGMPRIHTFCHEAGEKRVLTGPRAVWNIAHGESPAPYLAFRRCGCGDCVNPVHIGRARDKAEIGRHMHLSGLRVGTHLETRRANIRLAHVATGHLPTPDHIALDILNAAGHRSP